MSEFSVGCCILNKNKEIAKKYLEKDDLLIQLNDKWLCKLVEDEYAPFSKTDQRFSETDLNMSDEIPLLFFLDSEDHNGEFYILYERKVISSFFLEYGFEHSRKFRISQEMYGNEFYCDNRSQAEQDARDKEIDMEYKRRFPIYENEIKNNVIRSNLDNFKLFGITDKTLEEIQEILSYQRYIKQLKAGKPLLEKEIFDCLKNKMELTDFSWISYEYSSDFDNIIARGQ